MRLDESTAIPSIRYHLAEIRALLKRHGGAHRGGAGDSVLATFLDPRSAMRCAVEIHRRPPPPDGIIPVQFRIGIHVGGATEIDGQLHGDSVNIAARLQPLAQAGGICVSRAVFDAVNAIPEYRFKSIGNPNLKNIGNEIEAFHLEGFGRPEAAVTTAPADPLELESPPKLPSVAVLPFESMSEREDLAALGDGFAAEVIGFLTRFRALDVIAPESSTLGRTVAASKLAAELSVSFILTGRVQIGDRRIRVHVLLQDTEQKRVHWAEGYDRVFDDIFDVQEDIAECIAASMAVHIEEAERELARSRTPDSLDSYALQLRARDEIFCNEPEACERGMSLIQRSIGISQDYARAYAVLARAHHLRWKYSWSPDPERSFDLAHQAAVRATEIDRSDARGHAEVGFVALYRREHDRSLAALARALELNPSDADIIGEYADTLKHAGRRSEAMPLFHRAIRLNPLHADRYRRDLAHAYLINRDFESAIETIHAMTDPTQALRVLTASYAHLGRMEEAKHWAGVLCRKYPGFSARGWAHIVPDRNPADTEMFVEGLERAGL